MFYFFALFFATDGATYGARMRKIAGESYFRMINHVFLFAKAFASKTNHPSQKWHPPGLLRRPWGPLLCIVEFVHRSNLVHTYHLGITYLHTQHVYIYRLCMYAWLQWTYPHNEKCHSLWLTKLFSLSFSLRIMIQSLAFCCYCCHCSLLLVFIHFVFYRSFLARRLDGFYEKFCKLFFTKTVAV